MRCFAEHFGFAPAGQSRDLKPRRRRAVPHADGEHVDVAAVPLDHRLDRDFGVRRLDASRRRARLGLLSTGASSWICLLTAVTCGQHLLVGQQAGLDERRLELVDEVDEPARAADQRHPDFGLHLLRRGLGLRDC